ncbi:hypothetical protein, partial [Ralstonia solanacearum]
SRVQAQDGIINSSVRRCPEVRGQIQLALDIVKSLSSVGAANSEDGEAPVEIDVERLLVQFTNGTSIHLSNARKERAWHGAFIAGEALQLLDRAEKECQKVALRVICP